MGFTTGFLGGFTLTASVLYLTISLHTRNRITQAALLRQQQTVLKSVIEPAPPAPEPVARVEPAGLAGMAKDKWNRALETSLQGVYKTDWRRVREDAEDRVTAAVQRIRERK
ncbi:hypothetical protein PMIN06_008951 [Paraphaeosphaeria minitans]|uniref:MICOS complex subunit MIC12 n=1 Tax=Paraphaeosphaeria minitans TaxID=565426 RepID=A0A9P6KTY2_9PLEO|nr:hypothetical protein PMIN01_04028 [Paraphaeosphaeria minitans]